MMTEIPTGLQIVLSVLFALGLRELIAIGWKHYLGKRKHDAETDAIHLSNAGKQLADLREAIDLVAEMRKEMEQDKQVIAALKNDKIEDDRKIARRDGVIEEQRRELRDLHDEIGELRAKCRELEGRIDAIETENRELLKENYQLKGERESEENNAGRE